MLPAAVKTGLAAHLQTVRLQHEADLRQGAGWVELPWALARKYPNAGREWAWHWIFPATRIYVDRVTGQRRRHHLHESVLQRAVNQAEYRSGQLASESESTFTRASHRQRRRALRCRAACLSVPLRSLDAAVPKITTRGTFNTRDDSQTRGNQSAKRNPRGSTHTER